MRFLRYSFILWAGALLALPSLTAAEAPATPDISEWKVPWENTRPRDPWVAKSGDIWFVGQKGDYVARLDPGSGEFTRHDLESGTGPHTVIANEEGVWYAGNRARHIGLLDPDTGEIEKIVMPGDGPGDVHTMDFTAEGNIWFTLQGANQLGFLRSDGREVTLYDVKTAEARPYGLKVDAQNRPWATLFASDKLATVDAEGEVKEVSLPREEARPRRLGITDDGLIWYVDYVHGYLGRYNPENGAFDEWRTPAEEMSRPYAMGIDHKNRPWFVETGVSPNRFVGFDPETETFSEPAAIPSGGTTVRHMVFDGDRNAFWFGTDTNTIGRATVE